METDVQKVYWVVTQRKTSLSGAEGEAELRCSCQKVTVKPLGSEAEMTHLSLRLGNVG